LQACPDWRSRVEGLKVEGLKVEAGELVVLYDDENDTIKAGICKSLPVKHGDRI
jgi:hypothetical protein